MSRANRLVRSWSVETTTRVLLWESMVLFFLSFYLLCCKLKEFWQAPENEYEEFFECFAPPPLNDQDVADP